MFSRQRISDWIEAIYVHPVTALLLNFLVGFISFVAAEKFIASDSARDAFKIIMLALVFLAALQTFWFRYEFRRYFRREYIQEIVNLGGRTTRELQVSIVDRDNGKGITTLYPGKEYNVGFRLKGGLLARNAFTKQVTPILRMLPPLFLAAEDQPISEIAASAWIGFIDADSSVETFDSWNVEGNIPFDTSRINSSADLTEEVRLVLEFQLGESVVFISELGKFAVHLMQEREILSMLIEMGALKKLPPGYNVLKITSAFSTNLVFLPQVLVDLLRDPSAEDKVDEVKIAISGLIKETYRELQRKNSLKRLRLLAYEDDTPEKDLNHSDFIRDILLETNLLKSPSSKLEQHVYVSLFQTSGFLLKLAKEHAIGICLFGFKQCIPPNIDLLPIFDLSTIAIESGTPASECSITKSDLDELADCSAEYFQNYAPLLARELARSQSGNELSEYSGNDLSPAIPVSLDLLLDKLQNSFDNSQKWGRFVVSEPEITRVWVNLGILSSELSASHRQKELIQAIFYLIDRALTGYNLDRGNLSIVNLCSKNSGIAKELSVLWDFDRISRTVYQIPCCNAVINSENGEVVLEPDDEVTDSGQSRDVILLVPIDTYVKVITAVLEFVKARRNNVICVISLFSIARSWDFVTASEFFDVHALFQVDPDPKDPVSLHSRRITQRSDVRRLRPWLSR